MLICFQFLRFFYHLTDHAKKTFNTIIDMPGTLQIEMSEMDVYI